MRGLVVVAIIAAGLVGCTATVVLEGADDAINPLCAEVMVRLPETVGELAQRQTNAQGTSAWGTPATVTLRCGVPAPGPTTTLCVEAGGVDWIADDAQAPVYRFTTFGREPAVEVTERGHGDRQRVRDREVAADDTAARRQRVAGGAHAGREALESVANAVARIPQTNSCL